MIVSYAVKARSFDGGETYIATVRTETRANALMAPEVKIGFLTSVRGGRQWRANVARAVNAGFPVLDGAVTGKDVEEDR